jgi:hypothetical protein
VESLERLPFSIRVLLENAVRHAGGDYVSEEHVRSIARWSPTQSGTDVPFMPSRVVLQDFTGVPAVVDLAAMRSGLAALGGDPTRINPVVPADLVIDHSVQVDFAGSADAYRKNVELEYERNHERYVLLRWGQTAFRNFQVVPPGDGNRPPGQHRVPGFRGASPGGGRAVDGVPGYPGGNRLPHDDGERPGRGGMGCGGNRGRGGPSGAAVLHAPSGSGGGEAHGTPSGGGHRHRPGPPGHRDAPEAWSGGAVRGVLRAGAVGPLPGGPGHHRQHVPRVRGHRGVLPRGRADPHLSPGHRTYRRAGPAGRGDLPGTGALPHG